MIFSKSSTYLHQNFIYKINQTELEIVQCYKYLGFLLNAKGSLKLSVSTLAKQAQKAMYGLLKKIANLRYPPPVLMCKLFDAVVAPVCNYACELWGFQKAPEMELMHRKFCKFLLNVPPSTTNVAAYGELGRMPLDIQRQVLMVKYWIRLTSSFCISPILWECYIINKHYNSPWWKHIQNILNSCGLSYVLDEIDWLCAKDVLVELKTRLADQYFQKWTAEVGTARKMRLYKMFKTELCMEKYLYLPPHLRTALTKLRASCHQLQIERGRYQCPPIPAHERFCQFCQNGSIEDEKHFLLHCRLYVNMSVVCHCRLYVNMSEFTCREKISRFEALTTNLS